ncbi:hypothetical protein BDV23DRAFT_184591 [Aspergillus alliaceus]|uniref:Uncharacterized protein n=2 Tax=Petromyces alliaceus TaxID=209559 RepID=A0A5N7C5H3_PETAA|nr:hypothetical protein BDV23DRAFT_184591 [Aspergillus alliaceus]
MARLYLPGLLQRANPSGARITTRPAFTPFPHFAVVFRRNPPVRPRSFVPAKPPRLTDVPSFPPTSNSSTSGSRSFIEMRQGSHLPVRAPSIPSCAATPATPPAGNLSQLLAERRAARQVRPRPWAQPTSTSRKPSSGHLLAAAPRQRAAIAQPLPSPTPRPPREASTPVDVVHTKPRGRCMEPSVTVGVVHTKPCGRCMEPPVKKCVRFGEVSVKSVSRWIERPKDVYIVPSFMGTLQGWSVTHLATPDEDGEMEKYVSYWGSDSYIMLTSAHAQGPCGRYRCSWNALARVQARWPHFNPSTVFAKWQQLRAIRRERGEDFL